MRGSRGGSSFSKWTVGTFCLLSFPFWFLTDGTSRGSIWIHSSFELWFAFRLHLGFARMIKFLSPPVPAGSLTASSSFFLLPSISIWVSHRWFESVRFWLDLLEHQTCNMLCIRPPAHKNKVFIETPSFLKSINMWCNKLNQLSQLI